MLRPFAIAPFALAALVVATLAAVPARAQTQDPAKALHALFDAEWERSMVESPENASVNGDNRFNDRWSDNSLAAIAKRQAEDRAALDTLHAIDRSRLSPADQLNYDTFEWLANAAVGKASRRTRIARPEMPCASFREAETKPSARWPPHRGR